MQVDFGEAVFGIGDKRLGDVDGLVVDAGTKRASAILVGAGLLGNQKHMVGVSAVVRADQDGLHLDAPSQRSEDHAPVLDSEEVAFAERIEPPTTFIGAAGIGGPVVETEPNLPGRYPDESSFFEIASIDPPPVEVESNLEENEVVLGKDTEVLSEDGHKLGHAVSFNLGDMGLVESVTVSEGFVFKQRAVFSLADVGEFGTNAVHLRVSREVAESRR